MTLGGYWPPSSKVEIADFGGGRIVLHDVFFASIFLAYLHGTKTFFAFGRENSPVQPLPSVECNTMAAKEHVSEAE